MNGDWYDKAQICTNGHVINIQSVYSPEHNKKFCDRCGAPTITNCQNCKAIIRGFYHEEDKGDYVSDYTVLRRPSFCHKCGEPYPWTVAKLKEAQEFSDELDNLSLKEREMLKKSIDDIVRDTPQTTVSVTRFKKLAAKAGPVAVEGFKMILWGIVSASIQRQIWPS